MSRSGERARGRKVAAMVGLGLFSGGLWIAEPWRVMAIGFLYFTAIGISELREHLWTAGGVLSRRTETA